VQTDREITVDDAVTAINEHLANTRSEWTPVTPSTRLDDLGLDSFEIASIVLSLEEAKGYRLNLDSVGEVELVRDVAAQIEVV
jgi:acyl carrier protein